MIPRNNTICFLFSLGGRKSNLLLPISTITACSPSGLRITKFSPWKSRGTLLFKTKPIARSALTMLFLAFTDNLSLRFSSLAVSPSINSSKYITLPSLDSNFRPKRGTKPWVLLWEDSLLKSLVSSGTIVPSLLSSFKATAIFASVPPAIWNVALNTHLWVPFAK